MARTDRLPHPAARHLRALTLLALTGALALAGCAPAGTADPAAGSASASGEQGTGDGQPAESPQRIAALSYDVAETVAALGFGDRLVLVPASAANPTISHHAETMAQVPTTVPTEADIDPELIRSTDPDLVVATVRSRGEVRVDEMLAGMNVPVRVIENSWGTVAEVEENVRALGEALGVPERAEELAAGIRADFAEAEPRAEGLRVAVLSNQARQPFMVGSTAFPQEIVRSLGAVSVADEMGAAHSGPADPEQLVAADPDAVLLIDMHGSGRESFDPLLGNPSVASLRALAEEGRVLVLPANQAQALALDHIGEGVRAVEEWLSPLAAAPAD